MGLDRFDRIASTRRNPSCGVVRASAATVDQSFDSDGPTTGVILCGCGAR